MLYTCTYTYTCTDVAHCSTTCSNVYTATFSLLHLGMFRDVEMSEGKQFGRKFDAMYVNHIGSNM